VVKTIVPNASMNGKMLNDYALREKLQHKTGALRDSIVHKVLRSVDERLS
jgi:His-Xaa-Ser system protein HxsD